ncbi:TolC family protein [Proteobacteria bacterium 005FR1]|nr:TolC family protein [Proteobacteria bacterium 005FR1]
MDRLRIDMRLPFLSFLFLCSFALQAGELTEAQAVQRGMVRIQEIFDAQRREALGRADAAGRWDNPEIEYSREALNLSDGDSEERFLWLRQPIDPSGRKGLQREAARQQARAEIARAELNRRDLQADIRLRFYRALAAADDARVAGGYRQRLEQLTGFTRERFEAGDASRYDLMRLERELALINSEWLQSSAAAQAARNRLLALIGGEPADPAGRLLPLATETIAVEDLLRQYPGLQALEAEAESESLSAEAARRKKWPELTVGVGRREVEEAGLENDGNTVSLSVEVPVFDRGQGEAQAAASRARQRRLDYELAAAALIADLRSALESLDAQRRAAQSLESALSDGAMSLSAIAEEAYQAGELSTMELIDAYRSEMDLRRRFIERALDARLTFIELQRLREEP